MNYDEALSFAAAWIDAFNRHDLDAILELYDDDVTLTSPLAERRFARPDGTLRGIAELRDYIAAGLYATPTMQFELHQILVGVDGVTLLYTRESGAMVAEVMLLSEAGKVRRASVFYHGLQLPEWPPD